MAMSINELHGQMDKAKAELEEYTKKFQELQKKYQELGVLSEFIQSQSENIAAGKKLLSSAASTLTEFKVDVLISAKKETEDYINELTGNESLITEIIEEIKIAQNKVDEEAKTYVQKADDAEDRFYKYKNEMDARTRMQWGYL